MPPACRPRRQPLRADRITSAWGVLAGAALMFAAPLPAWAQDADGTCSRSAADAAATREIAFEANAVSYDSESRHGHRLGRRPAALGRPVGPRQRRDLEPRRPDRSSPPATSASSTATATSCSPTGSS